MTDTAGQEGDQAFKDRTGLAFDATTRVLKPVAGDPSNEQVTILLALYGEVNANWRSLHDVRFKLLTMLPLVSVAIFVFVDPSKLNLLSTIVGQLVTSLGLLISIGLWIYDMRNDELYNALISRARRIEVELGAHSASFLQRPGPKRDIICHGTATGLIYVSVTLGWLFAWLFNLHLLTGFLP